MKTTYISFSMLIDIFSPKNSATILDFGCGKGEFVQDLINKGYDAYGCDFIEELPKSDTETTHHQNPQKLKTIKTDPYQLPFSDNKFDLVISNQVFEHVMNYETTLKEIHRVLKPGGISLHTFPTIYNLIEPHVFVPLATIIRNKWWLLLWAYLGIRNQFQKGKSAQEVMELNYQYLLAHTNYLTEAEIRKHANFFKDVAFNDEVFLLANTIVTKQNNTKDMELNLPEKPFLLSPARVRKLFMPNLMSRIINDIRHILVRKLFMPNLMSRIINDIRHILVRNITLYLKK